MVNVVRIETDLIVAEDGTATITIQVPPEVAPGEHKARIIIQLEDQPAEKTRPITFALPLHDVGPWPEGLTFSRDEIYDDDGR